MIKKATVFNLLLLAVWPALTQSVTVESLTQYVKPVIGTKGVWFYGRTTPFVTPPFGMTHWTACTRQGYLGGPVYNYYDHKLIGFRASHKPAMWMGDYGHVTIKPAVGKVDAKLMNKKLSFSHRNEKATPHFYEVSARVNGEKIKTQITATSRSSIIQFKFEGKKNPVVFIDAGNQPGLDGWISIDTTNREIIGWNSDRHSAHLGPPLQNFKGYFVMKYDKPFESWGVWNDDTLKQGILQQQAERCGAWVTFAAGTDSIEVRTGTSFISLEQARDNLRREIDSKAFKEVVSETMLAWDEHLSRLQIDSAAKKQKEIFYSAMYHSLLFPREFSEYGRYYSAFDDKIHNGVSYNDYSLWDTYRAEHPLLILVAPERVPGMVQSLLQMYEEGGYMPKWPNPTYTAIMIATHADAVVADAVVKGVKGFDLQLAYKACMKDAMVPSPGDSTNRWADRALWAGSPETRNGLSWYMKLGYVPVDKTNESVANTLEGAYNDFCVAQVARAAGHMDDYHMLVQRSKNYINVFNPETGMMAPRLSDGSWYKKRHAGFTEGSPWTYLFAVQHDVPGLIKLLGGEEKFIKKLNTNFRVPFIYWHENEPGHHYTYLYDYAGQPWRTQQLVNKYRRIKYHNTPHGLTGDDDCGQMSAWYIFSALGFYPVTPGTDVYAIGTPLFPKAKIYFDPKDRSKSFQIIARNVSKKNIYIQSMKLNGKELTEPFLRHADIVNGGLLEFEMGRKPKK